MMEGMFGGGDEGNFLPEDWRQYQAQSGTIEIDMPTLTRTDFVIQFLWRDEPPAAPTPKPSP